MRTSSHHQPEAQHPKSPAIYTPAGRLPHLWSKSGQKLSKLICPLSANRRHRLVALKRKRPPTEAARAGWFIMFVIPRRHSHFIFAVIQSGLTCLIAAGIASLPVLTMSQFVAHWLLSWVVAWVTMLPVVLLAAPLIRAVSVALTQEDRAN